MAVEGPIAEFARGQLPYTWDALLRDATFGEGLLQQTVDTVKEIVFGTVIPVLDESDFPLRVLRWCGKKVALELISAGIDLWMNQEQQISATGTSEVVSFEERSKRLEELGKRLLAEVLREEAEIMALLGKPKIRNIPRMGITTADDDLLLTPDPRGFPLPYRQIRETR